MTSRNADIATAATSPPTESTSRRGSNKHLAGRAHKSSDRLNRLGAGGGSSTHLASKRSKSYTQVQQADPSKSNGQGGKGKKSKRRGGTASQDDDAEKVDEEGWTSASAAGTPDASISNSPAGSDQDDDQDDDDQDQGLVIASKRKEPFSAPATSSKQASPGSRAQHEFPKVSDDQHTSQAADHSTALQATSSVPPRLTEHSRTSSEDTLGKNSNSEAPRTPEPATPTDPPASTSRDQLTELRRPTPLRVQGHERASSSASAKTLTGGSHAFADGSPASFSSRMSLRSRTLSLKPRDSLAPAPPMLSTENAMANSLAPADDAAYALSPVHLSRRQSRTELPDNDLWRGLDEHGKRQRQSSIGSVNSYNTLPIPQRDPSSSSSRIPSSTTDGHLERYRQRTLSSQGGGGNTNSLTAADAAKLAAKLRQARDAMDEHHSQSGGLTSRVAALAAHASSDGKYLKPITSTFSKDQERIGKPVAVAVTPKSVFARGFTIAHQPNNDESKLASRQHIRYVARFGLSGPRIEKSSLNEALLAPSFDGDEFEASWAPALANAAGLGSRSSRFSQGLTSEAIEDGIPLHDTAMGSAAVNGPNATPVHLIHGLTTTTTEPFPLDPADTPNFDYDQAATTFTADPATLRAIALTSQMLSTHRSHTMTRRYYDPIRESIERCSRSTNAGAKYASLSAGGAASTTSGTSGDKRRLTTGNRRSQSYLAMSSAAATADDSEDHGGSIRGIKRVWSGRGMSRAESSSGTGRR